MNQTQARILREAHDGYVKSIYRKPKAVLASMYREELAVRGQYLAYGGPASKDELIAALTELRYPLARLNESIHVLYHVDGITNDACEQCNAGAPANADGADHERPMPSDWDYGQEAFNA